ncbi:hypothetical protein DFH08DRAFT_1051154 [Mycena albidolilacea]|uniref:DUF6535 domain-containing protein n=1 Tax=Mycena albidolilacea TaxID=1033008 RepID=A0AAD6Z624_9AGAR|nr:hypothetical protein DFH08DRAFT_1051154 [Mycena albidolilacea]
MPDSSVPLGPVDDSNTSPKGITDLDTPAGPRYPTEEDTDVRATRQSETPPTEIDNLKAILERLNTAVEALKQQSQSTDKETTFWTAYQKLADEFDAELQKKYGNNLDTSLIFVKAGLFSAVSSAFIIQIQPELQSDPNPIIQTNLLQLLVQNITGAAVPVIQMAGQTVPTTTTIIVIAQSLLYFSLFSTLLAALLAVLGKQWLLYYDSVGERGTIKERGLERQRKVDGLRRWKFDPVMQILPLLLQFALLLFAVGLSLYLWTVHPGIASMVLGLTAVGFISYSLTVISSMMSPDSPFQTSLSVLLQILVQRISLSLSLQELFQQSRPSAFSFLSGTASAISACMKPLLPQFHARTYQEPLSPTVSVPIFDKIPEPSQDISAIIWALETSTDPQLVEVAAAVVPNLQWPVNLNLEPSLEKLADAFQDCFDGWNVREGMDDRALSCIKAFGVLEMVSEQHSVNLLTFKPYLITSRNEELVSLVRFFHIDNFQNPWSRPDIGIVQWSLRFISAQRPPEEHLEVVLNYFEPDEVLLQNPLLCADFLFCINSFFSRPGRSDLSLLDKN